MVTVLATFTVTAEAAVMAEARLKTLRVFSFLGYDYKALLANDQCAVDFGVRFRVTSNPSMDVKLPRPLNAPLSIVRIRLSWWKRGRESGSGDGCG